MTAPDMADLQAAIARAFAIDIADLRGRTRRQPMARARQALYLLARWILPPGGERRSYPLIGATLNIDHSTIVHGAKAAMALALHDPAFADAVARAACLALDLPAPLPLAIDLPQRREAPAPDLGPIQSTARLPRNRFDLEDDEAAEPDQARGGGRYSSAWYTRNVIAGSGRLAAAIEAARAAA